MFNNLYNGLFGGGAQTSYNPNPSAMQNGHAQQHLQNSVNMANNAYAQNQQAFAAQAIVNAANAYNSQFQQMTSAQQQAMLQSQWNRAMSSKQPKDYRFNGVDMDAEEFANTIFPEDCAEKTYLILKMKGKENDI